MTEAHLGVDVSGWQGHVQWGTAFGAGRVEFVLAKMTEGTTFADPQAAANLAAARAAGKPHGGYHFLRGGVSGAAQCDRFLSVLGGASGHLCALDVEAAGAWADGPAFLDEFARQAPGHPLFVYSNLGLWSASGGGDLSRWPFVVGWHAGYVNGAYSPATGDLTAIWAGTRISPSPFGGISSFPLVQYTDRAGVAGIAGGVDGNVWLGTLDQLRQMTGAAPTTHSGAGMDLYRTPDGTIWDISGGWKRGLTSTETVSAYTAKGGTVGAITTAGANAVPSIVPELTLDQIAAAVAKVIPTSIPATIDIAALAQAVTDDILPHLSSAADPSVVADAVLTRLAAQLAKP